MATREEMLARLGLNKPLARPAKDQDEITVGAPTAAATEKPTNPNALQVDEWGKRRGREIQDKLPSSTHVGLSTPVSSVDVADFHESVFDPDPILEESCENERKYAFVKALLESSEHKALRVDTVFDDVKSEMATIKIAEVYAKFVKFEQGKNKKGERGRIIRAADAAARKAEEEIQEYVNACNACGLGGEGDGGKIDPDRAIKLFNRIKNSYKLRKYIDMAGRFRMLAQSRQRVKTRHGMDDIVGITLAGEVSRLVPSELANLTIPGLKLDTIRRVVESQALCREHCGYEPRAKGPAILCIDESGSMEGSRIDNAKALALAFAYVARQQNRWCALVGFSGGSQRRTIVLPPNRWNELALCDWLEGFFNGGTVPPIADMPKIYESIGSPQGKTDIIYITDGCVYLYDNQIKEFNEWRNQNKIKARVTTMVVSSEAGQMTQISDEVIEVSGLDASQEGVGQILSI